MPLRLPQKLDGVHEALSRIEGLLESVTTMPANHSYQELWRRSAQAREDIGKVMAEVRRIKSSLEKGKTQSGSEVANRSQAKAQVLAGRQAQTFSGLKAADLCKNKKGKVVSKRASEAGKQKIEKIRRWTEAVRTAKQELTIHGFCPVGGRTARGCKLHKKACEVMRRGQ